MLVGDNRAAFLTDVHGKFRPVRVAHALVGKFHLCPFQFDKLSAVGAGYEKMLDLVGVFHRLPDMACLNGGGACEVDFAVAEGLGSFPRQRYGVGLFLACAGVLVHLIQE